jgi:hypothetical protein
MSFIVARSRRRRSNPDFLFGLCIASVVAIRAMAEKSLRLRKKRNEIAEKLGVPRSRCCRFLTVNSPLDVECPFLDAQ